MLECSTKAGNALYFSYLAVIRAHEEAVIKWGYHND
jgi:hypothetical protein